MLINYFSIVNFGISNATNFLLVHNKQDGKKIKNIVATSLLYVGGICALIILSALYYLFNGIAFFEKYQVGSFFYIVCAIAIVSHFNVLFMTIYRMRNRLFELAFYQSIIPILIFFVSLTLTGEVLLKSLLAVYAFGNLCSLAVFILGRNIPWGGRPNQEDGKSIIKKGTFLFVYNICFYLIIISLKTIVSVFYSVEQFGYFTFSYTLANAILLFLQALTFIVSPKVIDKLSSKDSKKVQGLISEIRKSYVTMAFLMAFIAISAFPIFIQLTPKYTDALVVLQLMALTLVLYANSYGYSTYLMAQNKERIIAGISALSLIVNLAVALFLVLVINAGFDYVITATMLSYMLYTYLSVYHGKKLLGINATFGSIIKDGFPLRLLIPYLVAVGVVFSKINFLTPVPFVLFVLLNWSEVKGIWNKVKMVVNKPNIIDLS